MVHIARGVAEMVTLGAKKSRSECGYPEPGAANDLQILGFDRFVGRCGVVTMDLNGASGVGGEIPPLHHTSNIEGIEAGSIRTVVIQIDDKRIPFGNHVVGLVGVDHHEPQIVTGCIWEHAAEKLGLERQPRQSGLVFAAIGNLEHVAKAGGVDARQLGKHQFLRGAFEERRDLGGPLGGELALAVLQASEVLAGYTDAPRQLGFAYASFLAEKLDSIGHAMPVAQNNSQRNRAKVATILDV